MARKPNPKTTITRLVAAAVVVNEFGIPYSSLRQIVHRGELAVVKPCGRAWYFNRSDIEAWLQRKTELAAPVGA